MEMLIQILVEALTQILLLVGTLFINTLLDRLNKRRLAWA